MKKIFSEYPESITNIQEVVDKIEIYELESEVILPSYEVPKDFIIKENIVESQSNYLKKLTYDGAKRKYKEINLSLIHI